MLWLSGVVLDSSRKFIRQVYQRGYILHYESLSKQSLTLVWRVLTESTCRMITLGFQVSFKRKSQYLGILVFKPRHKLIKA